MHRILDTLANALSMCWHYGMQRAKVEMAYRGDFLINFGINLLYSVIQLFFIWALFYHVKDIAGWSFEEVVLIYGFGQLSFGYFAIGFFNMVIGFADHYIIEGNLDRPLLRPISPLFQLVMENLNFKDFTIVLKANLIIYWALTNLDQPISFTPSIFLMVNLLALVGSVIYCGVFLFVASFSFWVPDRVGFSSPLFSISEASRYPLTIYTPGVQIFFSLVIPFGFCAFYPAVYFVDPLTWKGWLLAGPFVAATTMTVGILMFNKGIRYYESTGS